MISQLQAAFSAVVSSKTSALATSVPGTDARPLIEKTEKTEADKASFSMLASQLNESAVRAAKRDAGMTFEALGDYGRARISEFLAETRQANSSTRAMEIPNTNDPELLDRARAASAFVARTVSGDMTAKNPFEKLSREQLNLIAYDDSGAFTHNERRAAWQGVQKMDDAWRKGSISQGTLEQIRTGDVSRFHNEASRYIQSLPTIERAVDYPKGVESLLAKARNNVPSFIPPSLSSIFERHSASRKLTLYDVMAGVVDAQKSNVDSSQLTGMKKFSPRTSPVPVLWTEAYSKRAACNREVSGSDASPVERNN